MYLIDYHSHSNLSPDSSTPLIENAQAAVAAGISELCITDHFDLLDLSGQRCDAASLNWAERVAQHRAVSAAMEGKLTLKLGVELGNGHVHAPTTDSILSHPELDFVIGSLHSTGKRFDFCDYYCIRYTSTAQCYDLLDGYFDDLRELVESDCYDVLGHIIVLKRYMTVRDKQAFSFDRYMPQLHDILKSAVSHGKGMELNTWCGQTLEEWQPVLKLFRDCGGEFITVGADAHVPGSIGKGVADAYELLRAQGFRYVTTYEKRKPVQVKL